jgi:hypothetical protein
MTDRPAGLNPPTGQSGPARPGRVEVRPGTEDDLPWIVEFGFTEVGIFREYAVKDGQYISSLWMERVFPPDPVSGTGSTS